MLLAHAADVQVCLHRGSSSCVRLNRLLIDGKRSLVLIVRRRGDLIAACQTCAVAEGVVDQVAIVLPVDHVLYAHMMIRGARP